MPLLNRILAEGVSECRCVAFGEKTFSYGSFVSRIKRRAAAAREWGISPGRPVIIYSDDDQELVEWICAVWWFGGVAVPMNLRYDAATLSAVDNVFKEPLRIVGQTAPNGISGLSADSEDDSGLAPQRHPAASNRDAVILFTSGSSGVPKGVPLTAEQVAANALGTAQRLRLSQNDNILITTPLFTTSSLIHFLTATVVGASLTVRRGFHFGDALIEIIEKTKVTGVGGVPANFIRLSAAIEQTSPPASLRFLMNSGENLPVSVIDLFRKAWPTIEIFCVYGLTEVAGRLCILDSTDLDAKKGSVGRPLPGMSIAVRDDTGTIATPEEIGEVFVAGPNLMRGYLGGASTKQAVGEFGFATGDLGYLDNEGNLYLAGRRDDVFKVSGEKVSASVIENAALSLGGIDEAAVASVDDPRLGAVPYLFYVGDNAISPIEIRRQLRELLPANHLPVGVDCVDVLPRTASGKIARGKLKPRRTA